MTAFLCILMQKRISIYLLSLRQLPNVRLIANRVHVRWGAYSMVQATLNGFNQILHSGQSFDYINLLSGQDYPLKDNEHLHWFLQENMGKLFMEFYPVKDVWQEALPRIEKYHFANYAFPFRYKAERLVNALLPARTMPRNLIAVGRSQWFTIPQSAVKYIVDYVKKYPEVSSFFKLSWAPDEMMFQTILYNSVFREKMENNNLRYIDWTEGKPSPKTFTTADADTLLNSGCFYARKLNADVDTAIFDKLDACAEASTPVSYS